MCSKKFLILPDGLDDHSDLEKIVRDIEGNFIVARNSNSRLTGTLEKLSTLISSIWIAIRFRPDIIIGPPSFRGRLIAMIFRRKFIESTRIP